jgi:hypothetical protein
VRTPFFADQKGLAINVKNSLTTIPEHSLTRLHHER